MHADIFIGLVYYQRLRHMVSDKSQVRNPEVSYFAEPLLLFLLEAVVRGLLLR